MRYFPPLMLCAAVFYVGASAFNTAPVRERSGNFAERCRTAIPELDGKSVVPVWGRRALGGRSSVLIVKGVDSQGQRRAYLCYYDSRTDEVRVGASAAR